MLPNNVSETHAKSGDPLLLDEAETGPLIPFKLTSNLFARTLERDQV
jgi:hypothetical protein